MGEEDDGGLTGVEARAGTIVWVRRRNGSWWPGRILGPAEVGGSHLMSPRSGTPVKLLGREDASVDWYNLEKSKRVKAFRCGEFDACIERAEALQGNPTRKREKYARREDAILHALELEKKNLEKKQEKVGSSSNCLDNRTSDNLCRESDSRCPEFYEPGDRSRLTNHKAQAFSKRVPLSYEEDNMSNSKYLYEGRNNNQFGWKEDSSEAIPRTRGLQDFGLRITPSKRKFSQHLPWESSQETSDSYADVLPSAGNSIKNMGHSGRSRNLLDAKRRRCQGGLIEDSPVKKRDRRRPLVQVLQSSAKVPLSSFELDSDSAATPVQEANNSMGIVCRGKRSKCIYLPADPLDDFGYPCEQILRTENQLNLGNGLHALSSSSEETETTSSGLVEVNDSHSSEREYVEPEINEDTFPSGSGRYSTSASSSFSVRENFGTGNNVQPLYGYKLKSHPQEQTAYVPGETGVSKWHMKGKRNVRNLAKRPMDGMAEKITANLDKCNGSVDGRQNDGKGSIPKMGRSGFSSQGAAGLNFPIKNEDFSDDACEEDAFVDKDLDYKESFGFGNQRYPLTSKTVRDRRGHPGFLHSGEDSIWLPSPSWEPNGSSYPGRRSYLGYSSHRSDEMVDVVLKVQASYHGDREHVPLVSLMSRLNGKAIVGHPIQIEILEDGSTDLLGSRSEASLDESTATPPMWRTGRRTAMQRVPRANPAPTSLEGEDPEHLQVSDLESRPAFRKGHSSRYNHNSRLPKRSTSHKKPVKKVSLSNQKIRALSSLGTEQKRGGDFGDTLGGLIKTGGTVPLVTCVPVKVVFSRILESIGRPPSAVAHRVLVRDPS